MGERLDFVTITCVGCQFNSGSSILEKASEYLSPEELMASIDLIPQPDNKYNPRALAWVWVEQTNDGYDEIIIGFVPDDELDDVWELLEEYEIEEVPSEFVKIKRTNRGEIQWIQMGCIFRLPETEEEVEGDMGADDNMSFSGFGRR